MSFSRHRSWIFQVLYVPFHLVPFVTAVLDDINRCFPFFHLQLYPQYYCDLIPTRMGNVYGRIFSSRITDRTALLYFDLDPRWWLLVKQILLQWRRSFLRNPFRFPSKALRIFFLIYLIFKRKKYLFISRAYIKQNSWECSLNCVGKCKI